MTETLFLRPDVHAVFVDRDLVLLDVAADRYLCLADAAAEAQLSAARDRLIVSDSALVGDLRAAGLATPTPQRRPARSAVPDLPRRSALRDDYPPPHPRDVTDAMKVLWDVAHAYRGRALGRIVASTRSVRTQPPTLTPAVAALVARFHGWSPWAPVSGKCLLRAFMLLRYLRRHGSDAFWVFGVRTWPFQAHCWLQCDDVVLDDPAERIAAFTPIMVL